MSDPQIDMSIIRSNHWRVVLNPNQIYLGLAWVTLESHASSISELSDEQWSDLRFVIRRYEHAVKRAFGAKLCNWSCLMNFAFKAAQPVPHVHWHVTPRYDVVVKVAGQTFHDPNFGHHYSLDGERTVDSQAMHEIVKQLRDNI